ERGCQFDGWTEHLRWREWHEAFADCGLDPSFYPSRQRGLSEKHPWAHIHCGVEEGFLRDEREDAHTGEVTPDCRGGECHNCGVCDKKIKVILADASLSPPPSLSSCEAVSKRPWVKKIRSQFVKVGKARFLGHLEMVDVFVRAARRAGIPMRFSEGFHPLPKISFTNPIPVGTESLAEFMDLDLVRYMRAGEFQKRLNKELPPGLQIIHASEMALKGRPLPTVFEVDRFLVSLEDIGRAFLEEELLDKLRQTFERKELILIQDKKKGVKEVNALDSIERLQVIKRDAYAPPVSIQNGVPSLKEHFGAEFLIEVGLKKEGGVRPTEIIQHILELTPEETDLLRVVKTESLPQLS
ncbi:MAG: TIGR03936 family radical SAM-associated protein, partial [Promethearchaeota archaeon]